MSATELIRNYNVCDWQNFISINWQECFTGVLKLKDIVNEENTEHQHENTQYL